MSAREPRTVGLSSEAHQLLKGLKRDKDDPGSHAPFAEMADAYRFAISLALAHGAIAPKGTATTQTFLNVGSLDPDGTVKIAIEALRREEDAEEPVYRTAERLAEWGVRELAGRAAGGSVRFSEIFDEQLPGA